VRTESERAEPLSVEHRRFIAGDPLRAVAAIAIVIFHAALGTVVGLSQIAGLDQFEAAFGVIPGRLLVNGDLALFLFFALSGYLLSRPFIRAFTSSEALPQTRPYLLNRLLRIVPAFWAVYLLTLLLEGYSGLSPWRVLGVFGFLQSYLPGGESALIGQGWTLDVEIGFYVLLPLGAAIAAWVFRGRPGSTARFAAVAASAGAVYLGSLGFRAWGPATAVFLRSLPAMLFAFVPGIALALLELVAPARLRSRTAAAAVFAWLSLFAALVGAAMYVKLTPQDVAARGLAASLAAGGLVGSLLIIQWSGRGCPRVLDNPLMHWLGERSYGIYLVHFLVGIELQPVIGQSAGAWPRFFLTLGLGLPLSVLLAAILYRLVEKPALGLRRRWHRPARIPGERVAVLGE